jgi:DMSO/TMAO reductase YedYZ molybdopterin-dependent catalytic subunit
VKSWPCFLLLSLLMACAPTMGTPPTKAATSTPAIPTQTPGGLCELAPISVPTPLAVTPGPAELDPSTGLHVTGKAQEIDLESYRLEISGKVDHPLRLTYDELRCMPKIEVQTTIVCKGNFEDTAVWAGASLAYILNLAGVQPDAKQIKLTGADGYYAIVAIEDALSEKSFLAYEWEKQEVPILHGFPIRAAFPGRPGAEWVKWLLKIEVE